MRPKFSVCMSVYRKDNANFFELAVESVTTSQTVRPDELVLVCDGPVTKEIDEVIMQLQNSLQMPFVLIRLPRNVGHAGARQAALNSAKYEYIAIMDSDDVAEPTRFEKQLQVMEEHPELTVCGGIIHEFIGDVRNVVGTREVPELDKDIKVYLKSRCPMNLQTVMYRKSKVMEVGGFIDWFCEEDYYLWIRLALANHKLYNIQESLVNVRVGKEMYQRRGGMRYFKSEARLQKYMYEHGIISLPRYLYNVMGRFAVQVAMPNSVRGFVFQKLFRK